MNLAIILLLSSHKPMLENEFMQVHLFNYNKLKNKKCLQKDKFIPNLFFYLNYRLFGIKNFNRKKLK